VRLCVVGHDPGMDEPTADAARRLYDEGVAAFRRGDNDECRRLSEAAIRTAVAAGSDVEQARGHIGMCRAEFRDRDYVTGAEHAARAEELATRCGDDRLRLAALHMRAEMTRAAGDYAGALPLYEELLAADENARDKGAQALESYNLGSVLLQAGDVAGARQRLETALRLCTGEHRDEGMLAYTLLGLSGVLARSGDPLVAATLLGAVQARLARVGEVLDPAEELELATHVAAARARAGAGYDASHARGEAMTVDEALDAFLAQ
jgi:tetratricopeptide (TPR) repeat protein